MSLEVIERLNALYRKTKNRPLTEDELAERDRLRQIYLAMIRDQVKTSLDQVKTGTAEEDGAHQCSEGCRCGHHH